MVSVRTAVLLVSLGTPDSPSPGAVWRYLNQFLTDRRVIDKPWLLRQLLVRLAIVPRRFRTSSALYQRIWTEEGSPLMVHSRKVQKLLQEALGEDYLVELGMRYQNPSIQTAIEAISQQSISRLVVVPLFPQYASATTGSIHEEVMRHLQHWQMIPETHFINSYATHPLFIDAFYQRGIVCQPDSYDHILFSYHGLPEKQLTTPYYKVQCQETTNALASKLQLTPERYSMSFQSRLGNDPWTQPYTDETICQLAKQGCKRLLVFAPAFTSDCLETIDEIGREYAHRFVEEGGDKLTLVPSLNDHPAWIEALKQLTIQRLG